jgi:hypothetical protein
MEFYAQIDYQNKIIPLYDSDHEVLRKVKKNTPLKFTVVKERYYEFHKKVMALFNLGFENQEKINSFDNYRKIVTMKAGFFTTEVTDRGTVYFADSISYANMDQDKFEELFSRLLDVIAKQLDTEPKEIREQVYSFM